MEGQTRQSKSHSLSPPEPESGWTSLQFPSPSKFSRYAGTSARGILAIRRHELSNAIVESAGGFPYSRKLEAHRSCVNALAFSSGEGRFMASGGDDLRICLWDFYQDDVKTHSLTLRGPKAHVYCLEFSATNSYLYAAGTCNTIFKYDTAYLGSIGQSTSDRFPDYRYRDNSDSIRALTCHPVQDEVFMSVSEDGTIRRYDGRQPGRESASGDVVQTENEVTGVQYHPTLENLFVTSDGAGRVFLRDSRMAFGPLPKRSNEGIVLRYNTKLTKRSALRLSNPESSSVTFDRDGSKLAVTFLHYLPTIYALSDPDPVAVLSGKNLPDGTPIPHDQRTYSNSCTIKHGSFGGPGLDTDDMYAGGSDDFRCYIWKLPSVPQLVNRRQVFSVGNWESHDDDNTIAFTEGHQDPKIVPVEIPTPLCRLTGHNSIVNTALFHPHFLHVVTAGVEKNIILHSPTPSSPCAQNLQPSPATVRNLNDDESDQDRINYYSLLVSDALQPSDISDDNDERQTLSLFDHIIREEGVADVFAQRPWRSPDSSDEEGVELDSESDLDDGDTFVMRPLSFTY